jgi:hypothetical protein
MFTPYIDSTKLKEVIRIKHLIGKTNQEISSETGKPIQLVSYYLKKLGLSRPRQRRGITYCLACSKNPVDPVLGLVCRDQDCMNVYMNTFMICQMKQEDAEVKLLLEVTPSTSVNIPMDTAVICTRNNVTKVWQDKIDHLKYHIYHWRRSRGDRAFRPPTPLWINTLEDKAYKAKLKDLDHRRKSMFSEDPQLRRPRKDLENPGE